MNPYLIADIVADLRPHAWMTEALCAQGDPDLHYPTPHQHKQIAKAKRICAKCPVRLLCLAHAMEVEANDPATSHRYGVLGGLTPAERYELAGQKCPKRAER